MVSGRQSYIREDKHPKTVGNCVLVCDKPVAIAGIDIILHRHIDANAKTGAKLHLRHCNQFTV